MAAHQPSSRIAIQIVKSAVLFSISSILNVVTIPVLMIKVLLERKQEKHSTGTTQLVIK